MKGIFIAGTDTAVGKTIVTGLLARFLSEKGYRVVTQKWIQTGSVGFSDDIKSHLKLMARDRRNFSIYLPYFSPYIFKAPCSPHKASSLENKKITPKKIIRSFRILSREFDFVLVEGVGGALVPLSKRQLVIDIVRDLKMPVLIVAQNKLGAINHTLLTQEALIHRKIKVLGVVFNNAKNQKRFILEDNPRIIKVFSRQRIFGVLPWAADHNRLYAKFIPIGEKIADSINLG